MSSQRPWRGLIPGDPIGTVRNTIGEVADAVKSALGPKQAVDPLPTVAMVDPARYAGRWYELARLPLRFQKDDAVSIAEYTLFEEGTIGVHNISYRGDVLDATIDGYATPAKAAEDSFVRLRVKFGGLAALAPAAPVGNYWILALAEDYSMALVGTPNRRALWLLARDPKQVDVERAKDYLNLAERLGFDVAALRYDDWQTRRTTARPSWS